MDRTVQEIQKIVEAVIGRYALADLVQDLPGPGPREPGLFPGIDQAVDAAQTAQQALVSLPLSVRKHIVGAMRSVIREHNRSLSEEAVAETGLGNVPDKVIKNTLAVDKTPGVEDLLTEACSDEHGLMVTERAPYGVIGAITPCTNPIATVVSNSIGMIAAGNAVVFNVHPAARTVSARLITLLHQAIVHAGGPPHTITALENPTIETARALMIHPRIALLVVTGGPAVVKAALGSGKRCVCAGPGNPPCVVDETADLAKAGQHIVAGAGFDHNIVCICEKEILVVESVADALKRSLVKHGAYQLSAAQVDRLTPHLISEPGGPGTCGAPDKRFVGKSPQVIAQAIGLEVPPTARILLAEVDRDHPLVWTEQLMPVIPLVRMSNADEAIEYAVQVEHGYRHTAMIHSHHIERLSRMAKLMDCSIFVKNGPCYAGLGAGGAGYTSFTVASPTGEGLTRARTFTRERRCTLVDAFRII